MGVQYSLDWSEYKIKNQGKVFEECIRKSVPKDVYYYRLRDQGSAFGSNDKLRFTLQNPYDLLLFSYPNMFCLELKSFQQSSVSYWSKEFEDKSKKQNFLVKKNQIEGLTEAREYDGIIAGLLINWRNTNRTYFWDIADFNKFSEQNDKKSFNEKDMLNSNALLIEQELMRTNYKYDIGKFVLDCR